MTDMVKKLFTCFFLAGCLWTVPVRAAPDIQLNAILGTKVIATVDGEQHTLKEGEQLSNGLVLEQIGSREAVFNWQGQRLTLRPSSRISTQYTEQSNETITIYRAANDHYQVAGSINDRPVLFLVDTGASSVSITDSEADRMGINWRKGVRMAALTAAGQIEARAIFLNKVTVQGISIYNVEAMVLPGQEAPPLLGMSFLRHFEMNESDNILTLKKKF
jgi:aspartyl protease family protein